MQGAGLTPLDFAICLLRIGGHLGRQEALRFVGYKYIYLRRVSPHRRSSGTRAAAQMSSTSRLEALLSSKGAAIPAGAIYFP